MELFFGNNAAWFSVPAFIGTVFFTLRLGLMLLGGDGHGDADLHVDTDFGHVDADLGHVDADLGHEGHSGSAFQVLSVQSVAAFMMGFGWGGLGGLKGAGWDPTTSLAFGVALGAGMVWLLAKLFEAVYRLQSSGNIRIDAALGTEGSVYVAIPPHREGRGRVRLVIGNRERFYNAVTDDDTIASKVRVRVTSVNDDNTITVTRAQQSDGLRRED